VLYTGAAESLDEVLYIRERLLPSGRALGCISPLRHVKVDLRIRLGVWNLLASPSQIVPGVLVIQGFWIRGWSCDEYERLLAICLISGHKRLANLLQMTCGNITLEIRERYSHYPQTSYPKWEVVLSLSSSSDAARSRQFHSLRLELACNCYTLTPNNDISLHMYQNAGIAISRGSLAVSQASQSDLVVL
jgi:hypothetical protein